MWWRSENGEGGGTLERAVVLAPYLLLSMFLVLLIGTNAGLPVALSVAAGGSMYPTVKSGDLAVLVSTSIVGVGAGDLAAYRSGPALVLHRIAGIEGGVAILEGDNNVIRDSPIRVEEILYKSVAVIPYEVWAPAVAASLVLAGLAPQLYLHYRKGRQAHSLHTYAALIAFAVLVVSLASLSPPYAGYAVKPNPMPSIERVVPEPGGRHRVWLNVQPEGVSCKGGACHLDGGALVVEPEGGAVEVSVKLPAGFNLTVVFTLNFATVAVVVEEDAQQAGEPS